MRPNRKGKQRTGSKGPTKTAPTTTRSPEHFTTEETSGLLASWQPPKGQDSLFVCDTELPGGRNDHRQVPTPPVQSSLEDGKSERSSYVRVASTLEAAAVHTAGESGAVAGKEGMSLVPFSTPSLKQEERIVENDGGCASGRERLEPASMRSDLGHHEEVQRGASTKGKRSGGPVSGGRIESGQDATSEKIDGRNVAGTIAAALTVRLHPHFPLPNWQSVASLVARSKPLATLRYNKV